MTRLQLFLFSSITTLSSLLSSCTYTRAVSQTNVPPMRDHVVEASVKKYIVLGFNFDNDEVLKLTDELREKCPGGAVRGITTKDLRIMYVLFFFWARETDATGYCIKSATAAEDGSAAPVAELESAP